MTQHDIFDHIPDALKHFVDAMSLGVIITTLADVLPPVAAGLSIVWTTIRILETKTVRRLLRRDWKDPSTIE